MKMKQTQKCGCCSVLASGESTCNSLFVLCSFALCSSHLYRMVQSTSASGNHPWCLPSTLHTLDVLQVLPCESTHQPWRVERMNYLCQAAPLGCASAGEFGGFGSAMVAGPKGEGAVPAAPTALQEGQ